MQVSESALDDLFEISLTSPNPLASVAALFCFPGHCISARVPCPLLVLDGVTWTTALAQRVSTLASEAARENDVVTESGLLRIAADMIGWLDNPERPTCAYQPLRIRQGGLFWPSVTAGSFVDYALLLSERFTAASLDEVKVMMCLRDREIRVKTTKDYRVLLEHSGVDGHPEQVNDAGLTRRVHVYTERMR